MFSRPQGQGKTSFASLSVALLCLFLAGSCLGAPTITLQNGHRYELIEELGAGSFGVVFSARSLDNGSIVAIKLFSKKSHYKVESQTKLGQLRRSSGGKFVLKTFDQGTVRKITDADELDFTPVGAITMERVDGSLASIPHLFQIGTSGGERTAISSASLKRKADRIGALTYQVISLWTALASNHLIDGDIKPDNLGYVGEGLELRLLDLGSIVPGPLSNASKAQVVTTDGFDAPEINDYGERDLPANELLSSYADLHSLSLSLLWMLCDGCALGELKRVVADWHSEVAPGPESDRAFAQLLFAIDVISAGMHSKPHNRYIDLKAGPLSRFMSFARSTAAGATDHYSFLRPSLKSSLEQIRNHYGRQTDARMQAVRDDVASEPIQEPPAVVHKAPKRHWLIRFGQACMRGFRAFFGFTN